MRARKPLASHGSRSCSIRACRILLGMTAGLPTTLIWGREAIASRLPLAAAHAYHQSIKGSTLKILDNCGHRPEVEKSGQFVTEVQGFLA